MTTLMTIVIYLTEVIEMFTVVVLSLGCIGMVISLACIMAPLLKDCPACRRWQYIELSHDDCNLVMAEFPQSGILRIGNTLQVPVSMSDAVNNYIEELGLFVIQVR
jgi:hypothetical protein